MSVVAGTGETIDVRALAIAIDHGARAEVQAAMRAIAGGGDTATKAGLARMLREVARVVGEARASWRYAALEGGPKPASEARKAFGELAHRARSRFPVEVIRNAYGTTTTKPVPELAESDEPGLVVVTLVVASRALVSVDASDARAALAVLGATEERDLVALEVIWSPSEEADRVSEAQVRERYPELRRIAP